MVINGIYFFNEILLKRYFIEKYINFIYSADLTFRIITIIDFNRAEPTHMLHNKFTIRQFQLTKWSFLVHSFTGPQTSLGKFKCI